jgi:pimeloyl-ACP methyl ester carboxylesterase
MDKIEHQTVATNGINMHIASIGTGPVILFLHGFPELWYSWRHQLLSLSSLGYRCIAPDLRGYGDTDAPKNVREYTIFHIVGDLVGLIDSLGIDKVFLVGHDWGSTVAWYFCLLRPDRIKALVNMSVVFQPRNPHKSSVQISRELFGDDFYICRIQVCEYFFKNIFDFFPSFEASSLWFYYVILAGIQLFFFFLLMALVLKVNLVFIQLYFYSCLVVC